MTSYGFVRFLQDGAHVTGLGAAMPEARLASLLHARGATVRLYDGKPLGSLRELSRTIARMRTDFLVLSCDVTTKALASKLSGLVRALRPTLNVIFWLQEPGGDDVPGERRRLRGENGAVRIGEQGTIDLTLQHEDLMT